jgi:hypothetical protein
MRDYPKLEVEDDVCTGLSRDEQSVERHGRSSHVEIYAKAGLAFYAG